MQIFHTYYCWFSHDVIKVVDLDILSFYFHEALFTNFPFERVLRSVTGYVTYSGRFCSLNTKKYYKRYEFTLSQQNSVTDVYAQVTQAHCLCHVRGFIT